MPHSLLRLSNAAIAGILLGSALIVTGSASAQTTTLYNPTLGTKPGDQGYLLLGNVGGASETFQPGVPATNLNSSSAQSIYAGYSNYNVAPAALPLGFTTTTPVNASFPTLNPTNGFTLNFTMQLLAETHTGNANRAGFSVLLLGNDKRGIEIGFQSGGVFSQSTGFTQMDTNFAGTLPTLLSSLTSYSLSIQGGTYTLSAGNMTLLTGATQDYTGASGFGTEVYRTSNFLFLGDDTTSAGANVNLGAVSITTNTAAPEPGSSLLLLAGALSPAAMFIRRRRS